MQDRDLFFLNQTLKLAAISVRNGNHPFGALLVLNDEIVVTSENEVLTLKDVTKHAELNLIQKAQKMLTQNELSQSILYSSTEPCAMCSGAIYWASIRELVFACSSEQLGQIAGDHLNTSCREILNFGVCPTKIRDYSYMKQFQVIHQNYWV